MPLLFSEGVLKGRIDIHRFVELTSTRAAKIYGMFPQKGSISIGADADLVIWDQDREVTIESAKLHDNVGYTPYEGRKVKGWPATVLSRGRVVVDGSPVSELPESRLVAFRRRKIGFIFQAFGLLPILSVAENVEVPLRLIGAEARSRDERVAELLILCHAAGVVVGLGYLFLRCVLDDFVVCSCKACFVLLVESSRQTCARAHTPGRVYRVRG